MLNIECFEVVSSVSKNEIRIKCNKDDVEQSVVLKFIGNSSYHNKEVYLYQWVGKMIFSTPGRSLHITSEAISNLCFIYYDDDDENYNHVTDMIGEHSLSDVVYKKNACRTASVMISNKDDTAGAITLHFTTN